MLPIGMFECGFRRCPRRVPHQCRLTEQSIALRRRMRALTFFTVLVGVISHTTVHGQVSGTQPAGSEVDFSGVYVAVFVGEPDIVFEPDVYPFTAQAERAYYAYDPAVADPRVGNDCAPERIPAILWSADPMEIVHEDGRIVMRFEAGDTVRSISVDGTTPPADQPHTELGYSVARWVGDVLMIETTHLMGGIIVNDMGQPMSQDARISERYWREPGEVNLQMELLVDDPVNYTEPLKLGRVWGRSPDEQVRPWNCFSLQTPRESEPLEVDELARMLEEL